jgi:hypothetical protein
VLVGEAVRQESGVQVIEKGLDDGLRLVVPVGRKKEARKRDERVAAPVLEPWEARDDRAARRAVVAPARHDEVVGREDEGTDLARRVLASRARDQRAPSRALFREQRLRVERAAAQDAVELGRCEARDEGARGARRDHK